MSETEQQRLKRQYDEYMALPAEQRAAPPADYGAPAPVAKGTRIRLTQMGPDPSPLEVGETGTVEGGNAGQLYVKWDSGRTLMLLPGVDEWEVIE